MKKIAVFNQKGGVAKTTSVVNIAAAMTTLNKKVLCIDCDSQMSLTQYLFPEYEEGISVIDMIEGASVREGILNYIHKNKETGISLIPASKDLVSYEIKGNKKFQKLFKDLEDDYDFCFLDLPPHLSGISLAALISSDYVLVPAIPDSDSLLGFSDLVTVVNNIRNKGLNTNLSILGVMFVNMNLQRMTQKYVYENTKKELGKLVLKSGIKTRSIVEQARFFSEPLEFFSASSEAAKEYKEVAKEIIKRAKEG